MIKNINKKVNTGRESSRIGPTSPTDETADYIDENGLHRKNPYLPAIPERSDASRVLMSGALSKGRENSSRHTQSMQRLGGEAALVAARLSELSSAEHQLGQKVLGKEKLSAIVKSSPYSNIQSQQNLVLGGVAMGGG